MSKLAALAVELAAIRATTDARSAIEAARTSDEPVVFITGNSHMPPLRAYANAEDFWLADAECPDVPYGPWQAYVESFEATLTEANVMLDAPDYDNSLYVVDLARFEYDEEFEGDDLNDPWRPITRQEGVS